MNGQKDKLFGIVLCFYTGLRIGELLALKWEDIDFTKGLLAVSKSCHDGECKNGKSVRIEDSPKTLSSKRAISLQRRLIPLIKEVKKKSRSDYVVSSGEKSILVRSY